MSLEDEVAEILTKLWCVVDVEDVTEKLIDVGEIDDATQAILKIIEQQVLSGRIAELGEILEMVENYEVGAPGFGSARFNVPGIPPTKIEDRIAELKSLKERG